MLFDKTARWQNALAPSSVVWSFLFQWLITTVRNVVVGEYLGFIFTSTETKRKEKKRTKQKQNRKEKKKCNGTYKNQP
jgi:hypothetical protein